MTCVRESSSLELRSRARDDTTLIIGRGSAGIRGQEGRLERGPSIGGYRGVTRASAAPRDLRPIASPSPRRPDSRPVACTSAKFGARSRGAPTGAEAASRRPTEILRVSTEKATGRGGVVRELVTAVPGIFRASVDRGINY